MARSFRFEQVRLSAPTSLYLALPAKNVEIEISAPSPAGARRIVTSGKIVPLH